MNTINKEVTLPGGHIMFPDAHDCHQNIKLEKHGNIWIVSCLTCGRQSSANRAQDAMTEFLKAIE